MRLLRPAVATFVLLAIVASPAAARTVHFDGRSVAVPRGWPVLRLAEHPRACVRLDRRAVYLGTPGASQRCPAEAMGRRRAILIEPRSRARARANASAVAPPAPVSSPEAFTGLGFDACAAPSSRAMSAWASHQRIHQYRGGHNESYGLTTINIDNNYIDGATVGATIAAPELSPLAVKHVKPEGGTVRVWVRCGWPEGETCPGQIILRTHARLPLRARRGTPTRVARIAVSHRVFRLAGGRSHTFRVALNERGAPLLRARGELKAQLLVAIPDARATRAVRLRLTR